MVKPPVAVSKAPDQILGPPEWEVQTPEAVSPRRATLREVKVQAP